MKIQCFNCIMDQIKEHSLKLDNSLSSSLAPQSPFSLISSEIFTFFDGGAANSTIHLSSQKGTRSKLYRKLLLLVPRRGRLFAMSKLSALRIAYIHYASWSHRRSVEFFASRSHHSSYTYCFIDISPLCALRFALAIRGSQARSQPASLAVQLNHGTPFTPKYR